MKAKGSSIKLEINNNILIIKQLFRERKYDLNEYDVVINEYKESGKILNGILKIDIVNSKGKHVLNLMISYNNKEQLNFDKLVQYFKDNRIEKSKEGLIFIAIGNGASIELYEKKLIIKRNPESFSNLTLHGIKGDKEIRLKSISAVQLSETYIQFTLPGGIESRGGFTQAISDENTVLFKKSQLEDFKILKDLIHKYIDMDFNCDKNIRNQKENAIDILERLANLKENNAITEEEYNAKKQELLKRI